MNKAATILCIEDESMLLDDLKEELEDAGYNVLAASNGVAALALLADHKPDLILCDMMMPKMDGPATLEHIRANMPGLSDVPFIFLTAKATRRDVIDGKRMGVDDYLTKPIDYDLLLATVEANLRQIGRVQEQNKKKLLHLYEEFKRLKAPTRTLNLTFVCDSTANISPLTAALIDLGCSVKYISEKQLAQRSFTLSQTDIVFLVYSKIVHYYLNVVTESIPKNWNGTTVLLAPSKLPADRLQAVMETGIDECVAYPYPPLHVFKLIMKRMQRAA